MTAPDAYIIRGGVEGKKRLEVLAHVMWPTTSHLLAEAGLAPGMTCLDLGCGESDTPGEDPKPPEDTNPKGSS